MSDAKYNTNLAAEFHVLSMLHRLGADANLVGGWGNDILDGASGQDVLQGGTGNDTVKGGTDSDTYLYFLAGEGRDTVIESGGSADVLQFDDLLVSSVNLWRQGNDLVVDVAGPSEAVVVQNQFSGGSNLVEFFMFGGSTYGAADIAAMAQTRVEPM